MICVERRDCSYCCSRQFAHDSFNGQNFIDRMWLEMSSLNHSMTKQECGLWCFSLFSFCKKDNWGWKKFFLGPWEKLVLVCSLVCSVQFSSVQFRSVAQSCPTLCDPMDYSTSGFPVHHQLPELAQTHVHCVGDAIQPSHPLLSPSPPAFNLSQHQGLFLWVSSLHQVAKVLEFQLQHQSFQWIFRTDFFRMDWLDLLAV